MSFYTIINYTGAIRRKRMDSSWFFPAYHWLYIWHKQITNLCFSTTSIHPCGFHPHGDLAEHISQALGLQPLFVELHSVLALLSSCLHQVTLATELTNLCTDTLSSSGHLCIYGTRPTSVPSAEPVGHLLAPESEPYTSQVLQHASKQQVVIYKNTWMWVTAVSPYHAEISRCQRRFRAITLLQSSKQHADGCMWLTSYDFLLMSYSKTKSTGCTTKNFCISAVVLQIWAKV